MSRRANGPFRALISFAVFALMSVAVIATETHTGVQASPAPVSDVRGHKPLIVSFIRLVRHAGGSVPSNPEAGGEHAGVSPDAIAAW